MMNTNISYRRDETDSQITCARNRIGLKEPFDLHTGHPSRMMYFASECCRISLEMR